MVRGPRQSSAPSLRSARLDAPGLEVRTLEAPGPREDVHGLQGGISLTGTSMSLEVLESLLAPARLWSPMTEEAIGSEAMEDLLDRKLPLRTGNQRARARLMRDLRDVPPLEAVHEAFPLLKGASTRDRDALCYLAKLPLALVHARVHNGWIRPLRDALWMPSGMVLADAWLPLTGHGARADSFSALDVRGLERLGGPMLVAGWLALTGAVIDHLPNGLEVGEQLIVTGTKITKLPSDLVVGGNLLGRSESPLVTHSEAEIRAMAPGIRGMIL